MSANDRQQRDDAWLGRSRAENGRALFPAESPRTAREQGLGNAAATGVILPPAPRWPPRAPRTPCRRPGPAGRGLRVVGQPLQREHAELEHGRSCLSLAAQGAAGTV